MRLLELQVRFPLWLVLLLLVVTVGLLAAQQHALVKQDRAISDLVWLQGYLQDGERVYICSSAGVDAQTLSVTSGLVR